VKAAAVKHDWRGLLARRVGWSLAAASLWVWGLLLFRMLRDGWQPLEVWFSYGLSFLMTAVYVYLGLLIYRAARVERWLEHRETPLPRMGAAARRLSAWQRPAAWLGLVGLATALGSIGAWLALRFPGPQAVSGTYASALLALMVLGVAAVATLICRPLDQQAAESELRQE
jgi:hypothetical protein